MKKCPLCNLDLIIRYTDYLCPIYNNYEPCYTASHYELKDNENIIVIRSNIYSIWIDQKINKTSVYDLQNNAKFIKTFNFALNFSSSIYIEQLEQKIKTLLVFS